MAPIAPVGRDGAGETSLGLRKKKVVENHSGFFQLRFNQRVKLEFDIFTKILIDAVSS